MQITSERTYTRHSRPHPFDIGILHLSNGESKVCWKANTEDDNPKVNPAEGVHVQIKSCVCGVQGLQLCCFNALLWPLRSIYMSTGWNRWAELLVYLRHTALFFL